GKAYVNALCKEGAKVIIAEYNETSGAQMEKEMRAQGYEATFVKTNVADEENVKATVEKTIKLYGKIDILINNAQATDVSAAPQLIEGTTTKLVKLCWETGFLGSFFFTKYCIPHMKAQNYGRILNTASATGVKGMETFAAYGSQKEAIRGLTRVTAQEYGQFGITCNVICPGALTDASKLWKSMDPAAYEASLIPQPIKRLGDPDEDIAPAVMFLVSDDARFVTAQTIGLDGGTTRF
ncbi:MAG: SDR family oxidoreductase, partial [Clostridia bacterium]|nr:SDR family oxidoreductase [Clostridia bacterium]